MAEYKRVMKAPGRQGDIIFSALVKLAALITLLLLGGIIVSLIIATVVVILFAAFVISLCGIYFGGLTGWQADIQTQFGSLLMPVPLRMNNFQFFISLTANIFERNIIN